MSPTEVNAAVVGAVKRRRQQAELPGRRRRIATVSSARTSTTKAIVSIRPTLVFAVLDANNDGQLSPQELQSAGRIIENQVKRTMMPDAPNSATNLLRNGQKPDQVAPVPNLTPGRIGQP